MAIDRKTTIGPLLALVALVLSTLPNQPARAAYPDRIIRIVVPFAPGAAPT